MKRSGFLKTLAAIATGLGFAQTVAKADPEKGPYLFNQEKLQAVRDRLEFQKTKDVELREMLFERNPNAAAIKALQPGWSAVIFNPSRDSEYNSWSGTNTNAVTIHSAELLPTAGFPVFRVRICVDAYKQSSKWREKGTESPMEKGLSVVLEDESVWTIMTVDKSVPYDHKMTIAKVQ